MTGPYGRRPLEELDRRTRHTVTYLTVEERAAVDKLAAKTSDSVSDIVRAAILLYIERENKSELVLTSTIV